VSQTVQPQSSSLHHPGYWWYRARTDLLGEVLGPHVGSPKRTLDVGSADAPSVEWMRGPHQRVTLDLHPEGLVPGEGVCGSATALPFADESFDVVAAFDVVEHCEDDALALSELARVLAPGGRMLLSVPAYQWAWSDHDVESGHHRRYTKRRFTRLVESAGLTVNRSTYVFSGVFPFFVAERALRRVRRSHTSGAPSARLPKVSPRAERVLMGLSSVDRRLLRTMDLPFGSSILVAASKPA
jgi:SAM-dependent methyltransferase